MGGRDQVFFGEMLKIFRTVRHSTTVCQQLAAVDGRGVEDLELLEFRDAFVAFLDAAEAQYGAHRTDAGPFSLSTLSGLISTFTSPWKAMKNVGAMSDSQKRYMQLQPGLAARYAAVGDLDAAIKSLWGGW